MSAPRGTEALLETIRVASGQPLRLERHRARMSRSAAEFGWPFSAEDFDRRVLKSVSQGDARLRVVLYPNGEMVAEASSLPAVPADLCLALSPLRVRSDDPRCRHKILPRGTYEAARLEAEGAGAWDGILLNERGEVAETGRANLVALLDGTYLTPPLAAGVLPGTIREILVESGCVRESRLAPADLADAEALFVTNALMGVAPVKRVLGTAYRPRPDAMDGGLEALRRPLGAQAAPGALR